MAGAYQVVVTEWAKRDINELLDYLLENASYGEAADARQQIIDGIHRLAKMPGAHSPVREMTELTGSIIFRQLVVKKAYRIIYQIREVKQSVVIIQIIHVKRGPGFVEDALS
ncbi:type II toxin-antitoxin system RelE/ParE family toxin [Neolewinella sp.]|uniref:type II toxin-antitoxin system RelE/ParE family toxin n=1 Tax=Neolewinella sp. TaxID=2993543 RepID=UPI003B523F0B